LRISVPGDLSVVGYDDIRLAQFAQLTTVRQHLFESGVRGILLLFDLIANPDLALTHLQLSTELIIRHTTAPPFS
jgi:DNA-binding LacI/PurR family transcriptional regulator